MMSPLVLMQVALHGATSQATVGPVVDLFTTGISNFPWSAGMYACYRIPSLVRLTDGTLVALASERLVASGQCGDESPSNIVMRRSMDAGATWSNASLVLAAGPSHLERSAWALEDSSDGSLFVFSNANVNTTTGCACAVEYVVSKDGGMSFSAPRAIPPGSGVYGSGLASGFMHSSGRLLGCMRKICRNSCPEDFHSMAFFSDDHGKSWSASAFLASGTTECQVAELSDARVYSTPGHKTRTSESSRILYGGAPHRMRAASAPTPPTPPGSRRAASQ